MEITIMSNQIEGVKSSVGYYIFRHAKDQSEERSVQWLCEACDFYKSLHVDDADSENENPVSIDVSPVIINFLPRAIEKNIFAEIDEMGDCDLEWICAMTSLYQQLMALKGTSQPGVDKQRQDDDNPSADGQEVKNKKSVDDELQPPVNILPGDQEYYDAEQFPDDGDYVSLEQPGEDLF